MYPSYFSDFSCAHPKYAVKRNRIILYNIFAVAYADACAAKKIELGL